MCNYEASKIDLRCLESTFGSTYFLTPQPDPVVIWFFLRQTSVVNATCTDDMTYSIEDLKFRNLKFRINYLTFRSWHLLSFCHWIPSKLVGKKIGIRSKTVGIQYLDPVKIYRDSIPGSCQNLTWIPSIFCRDFLSGKTIGIRFCRETTVGNICRKNCRELLSGFLILSRFSILSGSRLNLTVYRLISEIPTDFNGTG